MRPAYRRSKKWRVQDADWKLYTQIAERETQNILPNDDIDIFSEQLTQIISTAADQAIPISTVSTSNKIYWKKDPGVRLAKRDYNKASKIYKRHKSDYNLTKVNESFQVYKTIPEIVQHQSWQDWINSCNSEINSRQMWRKIKAACGVAPRPSTHPDPAMQAEEICSQFIQRSDDNNLPDDIRDQRQYYDSHRRRVIYDAICTPTESDRPFTLSELEHVLKGKKRDTAPGFDDYTYSMIRMTPYHLSYSC